MDIALDAGREFPGRAILMDGPLLPPKVRSGNNVIPNQKWAEWLLQLKDSQTMIAGIISGSSSSLLGSMMALASANTVWEARHAKPTITDIEIMHYALGIGERSAVFEHGNQRNALLKERGTGIDVCFLKTSKDEVYRVEIPQWITADKEKVAILQSSILADGKPLGGYFYVLTAAHADIAIPPAISNTFYEQASKSYLENGGAIILSGKRRMKLARSSS